MLQQENWTILLIVVFLSQQCIYSHAFLDSMLRFLPPIGRGGLFAKRHLQRSVSSSSSSDCEVPTISSTEISEILSRVPTAIDDEKKLSLVELSDPAFRSVENVIEYYEETIPTFVSYFEQAADSPSIVSSASFYAQLVSVYPTLDSAVLELASIERSHPSIPIFQPHLQSLMRSYSDFMTQLAAETKSSSPSLAAANDAIRHAQLTVPNLLTDAIDVEAMAIEFPSVTSAIRAIGSDIYSVPWTIDQLVTALIESPSSASESCVYDVSDYSTLLNAAKALAAVLKNSESMRSAIIDLVEAAESVSGVLNQVNAELSSHDKTFQQDLLDLSSLEDSWPPITAAVEWLDILEANNPSLSHALTVIEASLYLSPATIHRLISALQSPSTISDRSAISAAEMSHESFVAAMETLLHIEARHSSIESTMEAVMYKIFNLQSRDRTLLTAIQSIIENTNPTFASAAIDLQTVVAYEPTVTIALQYFDSAVQQSPSLQCDEQLVAYYDQYVPSVVQELSQAVASPSAVSSITSFRTLEASYPRLMSVLRSIYSVERSLTSYSLDSVLSELDQALKYDPSLTTQWTQISGVESTLRSAINYVASSLQSQSQSTRSSSSSE